MTPFIMAICCLLSFIFLCEEILKLVGTRKSLKINKLFAIYIAGVSLLFSFLLLLGNRNVLIITSFVLVYYVFRLLKKLWVRAIVAASILLALTIAININPFLKRQWKELTNFSETNKIPLDQDSSLGKSWGGWQLREAIWKCTWDIIKQHPVLGVGTGDTQDSLQAAYERRKFYFASRYNRYNTHNQYLQETVTHGFLGLSVFLFSLIMPFFAKIATEDKRVYYLFIFCFAFICLTDTPLELNKGIVWYSFFNALIFFKSYNFKHKSINGK
jgi:O-antigen ligase